MSLPFKWFGLGWGTSSYPVFTNPKIRAFIDWKTRVELWTHFGFVNEQVNALKREKIAVSSKLTEQKTRRSNAQKK